MQTNYTRIIFVMKMELTPRCTPGAAVIRNGDGWRLEIPGGRRGSYRLAQLDDYAALARHRFPHRPAWTLSLRARVSEVDLPGTWGFGLWNDPFGFALGFGQTPGRLPALPNAAWFFHASPPNWLSFHINVPAQGFFAGTVCAPTIPTLLMTPGLFALPLLAVKALSGMLRRLAGRLVRQEGAAVPGDTTQWHEYGIQWLHESVAFKFDGREVLRATALPKPPLGLVIWIDNQYAAWRPDGSLGYGTLGNPPAWLELSDLRVI
jgi:hypothetical protein